MGYFLSFLSLLTTVLAQDVLPATPAKGTLMSGIPIIGLGTARVTGNASEVIAVAIENGFRHIDCAMAYGNQKAIGVGIKEGLRRTGLTRQDLWITSKHFNDRAGRKEFALQEILDELQLDYLDLFLIHWPMGNSTGKYSFDYLEAWKEMEKLVRPTRGTRFIGVSNFSPPQVDKILETATIKPKVHQFELHPYLQQSAFVDRHVKAGITVIGYAPLGNTNPILDLGVSENRGLRVEPLLTNKVITEIAKARDCTPAQVVLAWNIKRKVVVIPKAARSEHQKENIVTLEKCKITDEDANKIRNMNVAVRMYPFACGYGLTEGCD